MPAQGFSPGTYVLGSAGWFQEQLPELWLHQNRSLSSHMWLEEVTPRQEEEEGYSLLRASLRSHTGSVRLHTTAGIKLMFCCFSAGLFSSFSFLRYFPLHIMARDLHFVSGCRGPAFEGTAFISQFCPPCFSVARSQALPYPPPGCGKSRDVMRSRGIDISKQTFWHWATGLASKALLKNCGDLWDRLPADKLAHGSQPSHLKMWDFHAPGEEPNCS